jgi:hypothetical protein
LRSALLAAALLLPAAVAPAQQAQPAQQARELGPDEAAWIDDSIVITLADVDRYLATVEARKPTGQQALLEVLQEAIVRHDAEAAGVSVSEADVTAAMEAFDRSLRAKGGLAGTLTADVDQAALREAMRLHVLQERLVRAADQLPADAPVSAERLQSWLDERVAQAALVEAPLDDARAAAWAGGQISKAAVGARLRAVLPKKEMADVMTEMIGVQLVRRRAAELGIDLTPAEVTKEVLLRDAALKAHADGQTVNYSQYVQQVEHRSLQELIQSDAFCTEVLVRLITEKIYTEEWARSFWEKQREHYKAEGKSGTWDEVRLVVWKDIRGIVYKQIYTDSSIVRRY